MSVYDLPTSTLVNGTEYEFRSDYRAVLDVLMVMGDPDLSDAERGALSMEIFYPAFPDDMPRDDYDAAAEYLQWFVAGGDLRGSKPKRKLADWEQDFQLIVNPVNRVLGYEIRSVDYLHWWTFLGAYYEIGDCMFAQIVSIRSKKAKGKKLEKWERDFYNENRELVDLKHRETEAERQILDEWMGVVKEGG